MSKDKMVLIKTGGRRYIWMKAVFGQVNLLIEIAEDEDEEIDPDSFIQIDKKIDDKVIETLLEEDREELAREISSLEEVL